MIFLFAVPFVLGFPAAAGAVRLERHLRPPVAVRFLTVVACSISSCAMVALGVVGYIGVGDRLPVGPVDWSAADLRDALGVSLVVGVLAAVALGSAVVAIGVRGARMVVDHRAVLRLIVPLPEVSGLTLVNDDAVIAYAVPCRGGGRTVVSSGMLRLLSAPQRRALLAHESAHLRLHHHRYSVLVHLAAAGFPLVVPVAAAVDRAIERWADLEAVAVVGDRRVVADALGAAALSMHRALRPALAAGSADVVERVRWLLGAHDRTDGARTASIRLVLGSGVVLVWASVAVAWGYVIALVEVIEAGR